MAAAERCGRSRRCKERQVPAEWLTISTLCFGGCPRSRRVRSQELDWFTVVSNSLCELQTR